MFVLAGGPHQSSRRVHLSFPIPLSRARHEARVLGLERTCHNEIRLAAHAQCYFEVCKANTHF